MAVHADREEGNLSSISLVSTISAGSSIHQPRPPDGPRPAKQPFQARRSKVARSPYLATSTPYLPNKKTPSFGGVAGPRATRSAPYVARERWAIAARASGFVPENWSSPAVAHPSASSFLQTLMKTQSFTAAAKRRQRTSSAGRRPEREGGDAIALQDEVVGLRKAIHSLSQERDLATARVRKLEREVGKRERQVEDLLAAGHITSRDATRSLAGGKKSEAAVISSLRQQLHSLERALRVKEGECAVLQRDIRTTRIRELEVESETYYQEVTRLKTLLEQQHMDQLEAGLGTPCSNREAQIKLKALNDMIVKLSDQLEHIETENKHLQGKLERALRDKPRPDPISHNEKGLRGSIADRYVDCKRAEMLTAVVDLELKVQEKEKTVQSLCREFEEKRAHYEKRIGALSGNHKDATTQVSQLREKLSEAESSREKLRGIIRKLKEDRTHYRTLADQTQSELQGVGDRLLREEVSRTDIAKELDTLREKYQNELKAREHAQKLAKRKSQVFTQDHKAATTIQREWRKKQSTKKQQKFQKETELAAVNIQNALRAHIARKQLLEEPLPSPTTLSHSDSDESVAIETIQSSLRGYFARQMAMEDLLKNPSNEVTNPLASKDSIVGIWKDAPKNGDWSQSVLVGYRAPERLPQPDNQSVLVGYRAPERLPQPDKDNLLEEALKLKKTKAHSGNDISPWITPRSSEEPPKNRSMSSSSDSDAMDSGDKALLADELT